MHDAQQNLFDQPPPRSRPPGAPTWRAVRYGELATGEAYALEPGGRLYHRNAVPALSAQSLERRVFVEDTL